MPWETWTLIQGNRLDRHHKERVRLQSAHGVALVNGCRERRLRHPILQQALCSLSFSGNHNSEVTLANRNEETHPSLLKERVLKSHYSDSARGLF